MSNVNPEDINAFAGMLGKLNKIHEGRRVVDTEAGKADRLAKNDMTAILSAFAEKSGTSSALTLNEDVKQLGATTPAKDISPVLGEPEKDHPFAGYLVGEDAEQEIQIPTEDGITMQDIRLLAGEGKLSTKTMQQAIEVIRKQREQGVAEGVANEDSLSDIKKRLGDYLQDIKNGAGVDDGELSKKNDEDKLGPAIKTIKTDDGKEIKIHGNEDDGFRLKINEKVHSAQFKSFDEAQMACETYVAKRKTAMENQDYVEEK